MDYLEFIARVSHPIFLTKGQVSLEEELTSPFQRSLYSNAHRGGRCGKQKILTDIASFMQTFYSQIIV